MWFNIYRHFYSDASKLKENKRLLSDSTKKQLSESNYEVVKHQDSSDSSSVIDTGKNIAYGQVHT